MRMMLKIRLQDTEKANKAVQDGTLRKVFQNLIQELKPEASYFVTSHGKRGAIYIFDMKESMMIPSILEPLSIHLNADVKFFPCMNHDELNKGLDMWMKKGN